MELYKGPFIINYSYAFVLRTNQENEMSVLEPSPKKITVNYNIHAFLHDDMQ